MTSTRPGYEQSEGQETGLLSRWVAAFVIGELVGFVPPALTGAVLAAVEAPEPVLVAGLVAAGAMEGATLGITTGRVLARYLPGVDGRRWVAYTAAAAGIAWLAGMGGSSLIQALGPLALFMVVPGLIAGLLAMGVLQWLVLRPVVAHSVAWIPVTSGAWLIGVMLPVGALSAVPNQWPLIAHAVVGVVAAVAMGLVVGLLTGHTLRRLVATVSRDR